MNEVTKKIFTSRDVIFDETMLPHRSPYRSTPQSKSKDNNQNYMPLTNQDRNMKSPNDNDKHQHNHEQDQHKQIQDQHKYQHDQKIKTTN